MPLLWIDLETTGLDAKKDHIIEVGFCVTDNEYLPIDGIDNIVSSSLIFPNHHIMTQLNSSENQDALKIHRDSGLLADLISAGDGKLYSEVLSHTEGRIINLLDLASNYIEITDRHKWTIAGSGIHFDLEFIRLHLPVLYQRLGYRRMDVSTIRTFFNVLGVKAYETGTSGTAHRAANDIKDHLNEVRAYTAFVSRLRGEYAHPCVLLDNARVALDSH